jgi:hypothetical protein
MKSAKEFIEDASNAAASAAKIYEAENGFNRLERLSVYNGTKASKLECYIKLIYDQHMYELAELKRLVADLESRLGEDEPQWDEIEVKLDARDRARDMNAELNP